MKALLLYSLILKLVIAQSLFLYKQKDLSPTDYVTSLINYCTGKSELDFCSREQIEFGLFYLQEFQRKIELAIEKQKLELIRREKMERNKLRRKQINEQKTRIMNQKLREHFLDRHF